MPRIAVLLTATALGLLGAGCGDSGEDSPDAVSLQTVTAPTISQGQKQATTTPTTAPSAQNQQTKTPGSHAATGTPACPQQLRRSDCQALAEAVEGGGGSGGSVRCTPEMTPEACSVLKQIAGSSPSSGSSASVPGCNGVSREKCQALIEQFVGG
jgi:hypothetical protein